MTTGQEPPGCVAIPVLIVVVPLRILWEVLCAAGRFAAAYVLRPIALALYHALLRPLAWLLYRLWKGTSWVSRVLARALWWLLKVFVLIPLWWVTKMILVPVARFLWWYLLRPLGRGLMALGRLLAPVLAAIGRAIAYCWRLAGLVLFNLFVRPVVWTWRTLVRPVLAATGRVIAYCWRLAGTLLFHVLVRPVRWGWRTLVMPVLRTAAAAWRATVVPAARWFRSRVWEPARAAARSVSRALGLDTRAR